MIIILCEKMKKVKKLSELKSCDNFEWQLSKTMDGYHFNLDALKSVYRLR